MSPLKSLTFPADFIARNVEQDLNRLLDDSYSAITLRTFRIVPYV